LATGLNVSEFLKLYENIEYLLRIESFNPIMESWNSGLMEYWFILKDVIPFSVLANPG
jgi:hypothetical protein